MPRDLYLEFSDRCEIWQALRQHCCRRACQISQRYDNLNCRSRGFETSRDLTIRRLIGYWNGAQVKTTLPHARDRGAVRPECSWLFLPFQLRRLYNSYTDPWWPHQMETFSALLAICARNSPVPVEFPTQRPVRRIFDVYFNLSPNWWFETPSRQLWCHRYDPLTNANGCQSYAVSFLDI